MTGSLPFATVTCSLWAEALDCLARHHSRIPRPWRAERTNATRPRFASCGSPAAWSVN